MGRKSITSFFVILFLALVFSLFYLNRWIQGRVGDIVKNPVQEIGVTQAPEEPVQASPKRRLTGEVFEKTRMAPDRTFEQSIFYQAGQEIARHRVTRQGDIYDQTGVIPDGKVKFVNETNETYGAEIYKDGKRHGPRKVYYKDGPLKEESYYQFGKLMTHREYFHDGSLNMEADFTDARDYGNDRDVGVGKVYFRDGRLKYEWQLINADPVGFQKSYNRQGTLTGEVYFDANGDVIPPAGAAAVQAPASSPAP